MYNGAVAMFCGPHDEGNDAPTRRIDKAIEVALRLGLPLMIAGDGNVGKDVAQFSARARLAGIGVVVPLYDQDASTLSDALCVAEELRRNPELKFVQSLHLVTDVWHMERAHAMLVRELNGQFHADSPTVIKCGVDSGPEPAAWVLEGERKGLADYQSGLYGSSVAYAPWGKPAHTLGSRAAV